LLGILVGEQIIPVGKQLLAGMAFSSACVKTHTISHIFGQLPGNHTQKSSDAAEEKRS